TITSRTAVVWSSGGSGTHSEVHVLSPSRLIQIATLLKRFRVTAVVANATKGCVVTPVFQTTNDGESWSDPEPVDKKCTVNGSGTATSGWFEDVARLGRGIRFGVVVGSKSGVSVHMARVILVMDLDTK